MCRACGGTKKFALFTSLIDCPYCVTGEAVLGDPPPSLADSFKSETVETPPPKKPIVKKPAPKKPRKSDDDDDDLVF